MSLTEKEYLQAKLQLAKLRVEDEKYQAANKIEFWKPWAHQQRILDLLAQGKRTLLLQGSNRIGKSVLGTNIVGSFCLGKQPWDGKPTKYGDKPIKSRIICVDWEHHAQEVIVPKLYEWLPQGSYYTPEKNNVGIDAFWNFRNKSSIELLTHLQPTKVHEGWEGHIIWADEPLPYDKYLANKRGLIDQEGIFILTMTAIYEPWVMDEIAYKNENLIGCVTEIPMTANPLLTKEAIEDYSRACSPEQRLARVEGGWYQLAGKVWKAFDMVENIVKPFKVPPDWAVVAMIDYHLNKPHAIGFYSFDPWDRIWVIDEIWQHLPSEQIGHEIAVKKMQNCWNLTDAFIDPLSKGDKEYIKNRGIDIEDTYTIVERTLAPYGIRLHVASKDKLSGITNVEHRWGGLYGTRSLHVFDTCERHIFEIPRWVYDADGLPKKENDHFCENLYRLTLTGVKYVDPKIYSEPIYYKNKGVGIV